jgi:tungstate transport system ATP-binding protein
MLLQCNNIEKYYNGKKVLNGISIESNPEKITVFIGPNGAGKTTLFKIIGLLEKPDKGEILFAGKTVAINNNSFRKNVGMVFQYPILLDRTVWENLAFGLKKRKETHIEKKVKEMIQQLWLEKIKDKNAREISGGERKRVAIGMVLLLNTAILLLDECFANLDPLSSKLLENLICDLKRRGDTTILLSTHSLLYANSLGDHIYFMKNGRIIEQGSPKALFEKPFSRYAADYFGQKNIFAGTIQKTGEDRIVNLSSGLKISIVTELEGEVFIYIPPSDIIIAVNPIVSSALNNFRGTITGIESQGQILCLTINIGISIEALITRKSMEELHLEFGKEVHVAWKASAVHVFKEMENE